jgi:chromosome partitioning protein
MGKILLVVSDKGGVGKSTYSANTASMLANREKSVIILKKIRTMTSTGMKNAGE